MEIEAIVVVKKILHVEGPVSIEASIDTIRSMIEKDSILLSSDIERSWIYQKSGKSRQW